MGDPKRLYRRAFSAGIGYNSDLGPIKSLNDSDNVIAAGGIEKYFLNENSDYLNINDLDISELIRDLKKRYSLHKFSKVIYLPTYNTWLAPFSDYAIKNPEKCKDVLHNQTIFDETKEDAPTYEALSIIDEDFAYILRKNYVSETDCALLFFNDPNFIKEKFFDNIQYYKEDVYELVIRNNNYALEKININFLEEPILEESINTNLNKDIQCFFSNKEFYEKNNLPYKRGLILHGPAGCGKTSFIKKVLSEYKNCHRLLIDCKLFSSDISYYLKKVFPENCNKIVVFEDVESIGGEHSRSYGNRSGFLNFIDGAKTMCNTLFIATTNYPDLVDPALINRPSRFDKIYKIDYPSKLAREKFLLRFFPNLKDTPEILKAHVEKTSKFSGAHFKELFIMVGIQNSTIAEAIETLNKQIKICKEQDFEDRKRVGFGD